MRKIGTYVIVPVVMGVVLLTAGTAFARGFGAMGAGLTPDQRAANHQDRFQREASLLGVSVDEVKNAWAQGKSLGELAKAKGITKEQLAAKMKDAKAAQLKAQLQDLVSRGIITQAQADTRLDFVQSKIGKGHGEGGGMHRGLDRF